MTEVITTKLVTKKKVKYKKVDWNKFNMKINEIRDKIDLNKRYKNRNEEVMKKFNLDCKE